MTNYYMNCANKMAKVAFNLNEVPIGCVIVYENKIIGQGHNTREKDNDVLGHAELNAIKEASRYLSSWNLCECEMYVSVEPCLMCYGAILQSRIKVVYIGSYQDAIKKSSHRYYLGSQDIINDTYLNEESKTIIQSFFKFLRKGNND